MSKTERIYIRISSDELERAKVYAIRAGLTLSNYARNRLLQEPVAVQIPEEFHRLRRDISGLCTNVNQIAHAVNASLAKPTEAAIQARRLAQQTYEIVKGMVNGNGSQQAQDHPLSAGQPHCVYPQP